jgi:Zn-dependent alcohol dehydrogenase
MVTCTAPLEAWDDALQAMRDGDVIRTVLTP